MSKHYKTALAIGILGTLVSLTGMEVKPKDHLNKLLERVQRGDPEILRAFLNYKQLAGKLDINGCDEQGWQPIHHAVMQGSVEIVNTILDFGAKLNEQTKDERGRRPLHFAASGDKKEIFMALIEKGADPTLTDNLGHLPIYHAISKKMEQLIASVKDTNLTASPDSINKPPAPLSLSNVRRAISDKSLEQEISTLPQYEFRATPGNRKDHIPREPLPKFQIGAWKVQSKEHKNISVTKEQKKLNDKFLRAAGKGKIDRVKKLIRRGADINTQDLETGSPLHFAALRGHLEIVKLLVENGADIKLRKKYAGRPGSEAIEWVGMASAAMASRQAIIAYLLENGADIHADGFSPPIVVAIREDKLDLVEWLYAKGININAQYQYYGGMQAIHFAISQNKKQITEWLLARGATIDAQDNNGTQPIHLAAKVGNLALVMNLYERGALIDAQNNEGIQPIHLAAEHGNLESVKYLYAHGANINAKDSSDKTPLWYAKKTLKKRQRMNANMKDEMINIIPVIDWLKAHE